MSWHAAEEQHRHPHPWLGDAILGLNDGIVTTLVFALSVSGAAAYKTVILAGLAEMFAGGVSMFLGGFVAGQSEKEAAQHQIEVERHEIEYEPDEEREELRNIYRQKGFSGTQLTSIVEYLTSDRERWLNSMIRDELMMNPGEFRSPWQIGVAVGVSFVVGASVPVAPFLLGVSGAPIVAAGLSILTLFVTGAARSRYSHKSWLRNGAQMVLVGLLGAAAGLLIGKVLSLAR